jgi:hypothetical protein
MQLYDDLDIVSFIRISMIKWISYVNCMDDKRKVNQVFSTHPQGSRLRGRPKSSWWDYVQADIIKCKIKNWRQWPRNREEWKRSIEEVKVCIGL